MTIGRRPRSSRSHICPGCHKLLTQHGLQEHNRKKRCRVTHPRQPPRTRKEQRQAQKEGTYFDPFEGLRLKIHVREDGRFECRYCRMGLKRIDKMEAHVKYSCTAVPDLVEVIYMENFG